ncbi:MAG: pilus assembly protein PilM [Candidatus Omnitrophica bacterium]|nr:pilus assembly protein PilM [Candidatus Omnitrophota bacterium]
MKSTIVFYMSEGMIKFLQTTGTQKKVIAGLDVIDTNGQSDVQISRTLNAFVKQRKLSFAESRVIVVIPRSRAILRYMSFPSQKPDEIRAMIDLQVGSRIPYARQEVEIDFQVLSISKDGYARVAVVIIPQDMAIRYWKIFLESGIPVHQMTISSVGLWLLYREQPGLLEKLGAIIDLDVNHSEICVCYKTHWLNSREIPVGFVQMQRDGYTEFLKQWELTQSNIIDEKIIATVGSVYLVSWANRASGLGAEMMKLQGGLTVKDILFTNGLPVARGVAIPQLLIEGGISMSPLAGIALSPGATPIDLTPQSIRDAQKQRANHRQMVVMGIWVLAALLAVGLALGVGFLRKNIRLNRLEDELKITKRQAANIESQLRKVYDVESVLKDRMIFSDFAREIDRLLPSQISLVSIAISNGHTLSLQGVSMNSADINQFQKGMVDSPYFYNVNLDYVNKRVTQQGEVDYFKITCVIKTVKQDK